MKNEQNGRIHAGAEVKSNRRKRSRTPQPKRDTLPAGPMMRLCFFITMCDVRRFSVRTNVCVCSTFSINVWSKTRSHFVGFTRCAVERVPAIGKYCVCVQLKTTGNALLHSKQSRTDVTIFVYIRSRRRSGFCWLQFICSTRDGFSSPIVVRFQFHRSRRVSHTLIVVFEVILIKMAFLATKCRALSEHTHTHKARVTNNSSQSHMCAPAAEQKKYCKRNRRKMKICKRVPWKNVSAKTSARHGHRTNCVTKMRDRAEWRTG